MFRIHFTQADLIHTRIAREPDPMWEVVLSLHTLQTPGNRVFTPWRQYAVRSLSQGTVRRLMELAPPIGYFPDFLTPIGPDQSLEEELEIIQGTAGSALADQIQLMTAPNRVRGRLRVTRWMRDLHDGSAASVRGLADCVRDYDRFGLGPFWAHIRSAIAADRAERVEQYAQGGLDALLDALHPSVHWRPPYLEVENLNVPDLHLDGRGLLLQPSYFCDVAPTKLHECGDQPVLIYPIRSRGLLRIDAAEDHDQAAALLGSTRAAALAATVDGCTTSQLARACGVAVSTASQHATVLRESGLTRTDRDGSSVVHQITDLGLRLLDGAAGPAIPRPRRPVSG